MTANQPERSELAAARSENTHLRAAIDQTDDAVVIADAAGTITYVNPAFERITGYSAADALGANPRILKSGRHDDAFYREMWAQITSGQTWTGTMVNRRKDGVLFTEQATISPVRGPDGQIVSYVAVKRDISEQLRLERDKAELEEQMRQSQKLDALGQLAGGVAHDFNNMIAAIRSNAELAIAHADAPSNPEQIESLEDILAASERASKLTGQLLAFARKQVLAPQVLELGELIEELRSMLERLLTSDVRLETRPPRGRCALRADKSQLQQVVMNLALNARDAMPRGGHLVIEAREVVLDAAHCEQNPDARPGDYVMLAVSDTGVGMSEEVRPRIFEPFFTTKGGGRGTGLGLSTVFGIVQQSGGHIDIYSELGQGTTVRVFLPAATRSSEQPTKPPRAQPRLCGGDETILVVEDDPLVLRASVAILQRAGYHVLQAESGEEAELLASSYPGRIDLLFTDVVMPGISGPELARALCGARPELRVLYTSGYTRDIMVTRGGADSELKLLEKPFSAATLAERVRSTLDGAGE